MGFFRNVWEGFVAFIKSIGRGIIQIIKGIFKVIGTIIGALAGILGGFYSMIAKGFYKLFMVLLKPKYPTNTIDSKEIENAYDHFEEIINANPDHETIYVDFEETSFAVVTDENNKVVSVKSADISEVSDQEKVKKVLNREGVVEISPMTA